MAAMKKSANLNDPWAKPEKSKAKPKPLVKVKPKAALTKPPVRNPNAPKGGTPPTGNVRVVPPTKPKRTPPRGSTFKGGRSSRGGGGRPGGMLGGGGGLTRGPR